MKYPQLVSMPSAVSDWLEEQLEARGIDAVVYTRYILSLLHSDAVDVIYSDEDLHFSHFSKEVRRSGGSRKRFRRSSDWWKYAQADAEKLKRSAAVECLMSASEQTCGIESLIDELCAKLNEIKSDVHAVELPASKKPTNPELQHASPQELANRYYAAFPPLTRSNTSPSSLISLIPKWIPSPKKKPSHNRRHSKLYDETMKANRTVGKQRYGGYFTGRNNGNTSKKESRQMASDWSTPKKSRTDSVPKSDDVSLDWPMTEDENLYDDLPVDIKELLDDSPAAHDVTVAMMNLANMRDTGRRGFIPCGTNITSSIWTNASAVQEDALFGSDSVLDLRFESISIDWTSTERESTWQESSWSEEGGHLALSLVRLNHAPESSAFAECRPRRRGFGLVEGTPVHGVIGDTKMAEAEKEKDDLLTSVRSHFRPINEKVDRFLQGQYADGATFVVSNNWDKVNYRRTESGAMYVESDYSMRKKYCEYKVQNGTTSMEFVLKYLVCQNDKGCQTEDLDAEVEAINSDCRSIKDNSETKQPTSSYSKNCTCRTLATKTDHSFGDCPLHPTTDGAVPLDIVWQQQPCDNCCDNSLSLWSAGGDSGGKEVGWQFGTISNIWSGGVVCHSCLGRPPSTPQHSRLREDVSQDGDQLLSDLSSLQHCYMQEELPVCDPAESSCDLDDLLAPKRRRSLLAAWSFATRLEEDCLVQMAALPTLRSVTL